MKNYSNLFNTAKAVKVKAESESRFTKLFDCVLNEAEIAENKNTDKQGFYMMINETEDCIKCYRYKAQNLTLASQTDAEICALERELADMQAKFSSTDREIQLMNHQINQLKWKLN